MNSIVFLILRQMRAPLLVLSTVYAMATLGLTMIPGLDDKGEVWYMDFFHAFYFVTFMGTTIGFGEIPYPFTDAQRMWALIFIYFTVATWIYAIGTLIRLLQNETLIKALTENRFQRKVEQICDPFFVVCGFGDTGVRLVKSLRKRLIGASVLDIKQERIDALLLAEHPMFIPGLQADASDPQHLMLAGITHPQCKSVVALTDDNAVNLHIAITVKVLNPSLKVICRADSQEIEANMASFGTDFIINPFDTFARDLALAMSSPYQYMLNDWFRNESGEPLSDVMLLPKGRWLLCGFGRFGRAIHRELLDEGMTVQVIEPNKATVNLPVNAIIGDGTEAVTLNQADISGAVGIIAGADDDSNNLSIIVTARELNPDLFVVARQNHQANSGLFEHSGAQLVMEVRDVLATKIRTLLTNPLIDDFLSLARAHNDNWAQALTEQIRGISPMEFPEVWECTLDEEGAYAVVNALEKGADVRVEHLTHNHLDRDVSLPILTLFHSNARGAFCMPSGHVEVAVNDRLLFAGSAASRRKMQWNLQNELALNYVLTGANLPQTAIGRWLQRVRA